MRYALLKSWHIRTANSWPFSLLSLLHVFRREITAAMAYLDAADVLAAEQHLSSFLNITIVRSMRAMAENRAMRRWLNIRKGMEIGQASNLMRPYYLGLLAEALGAAGDKEGAMDAIFKGLSSVETSGERWWEAEVCRLRGELLRCAKKKR